MSSRFSYAAIAVAVVSVSFSAILVRLSTASPVIIAFYRLLFTVLLLGPLVTARARVELRSLPRKQWLWALLSGLFLGAHYVLWFASLERTSVASSTVLVTMHPLFVLVLGYLFWGETTTTRGLAGLALALAGGVVLGWNDHLLSTTHLEGDLLALAAAALITGYLLIGRHLRRSVGLLTYVGIVYSMGTLVLLLFAAVSKTLSLPASGREYMVFLGLAVGPTILGHTMFNWALKYVPAAVVSVSILGEAVGASLWAYLFFGERISSGQFVGGLMVLVGVAIFVRTGRRREGSRDHDREEAVAQAAH